MSFASTRRSWLIPAACGVVCLVPLLANRAFFADLFLFGDEWDQVDQIDRHGFFAWVFSFFGENFAPLFKLVWGGSLLLGSGSYFTTIVILWLLHAVNVALLGGWLRQAGFGWPGTLCAVALFGLTSSNIETLAWSACLLTVQGTTFFLLAALYQERSRARGTDGQIKTNLFLAGLILASALSFVRGILTGGALAVAQLWPTGTPPARPWPQRLRSALLCLAPALAVAALIALFTGGNHQAPLPGTGNVFQAAGTYGLWYFLLNPFHRLLEIDSFGWRTCTVLGLGKVLLLGWALWRATGSQRRLLVMVLLFDLGTAALLGLGRYHTGLETTISSRYQYSSLLCTLPFLAVAIDTLLAACLPAGIRRVGAAAALAALLGFAVARQWTDAISVWSGWRGREARQILLSDPHPPAQGAVPGIPSMPTARAKELIHVYHLH